MNHLPERRDIGRIAQLLRNLEQPREHGRNHVARGHLVLRDPLEHPLGCPAVHQHHRVAQVQVVGRKVDDRRVIHRRHHKVHPVVARRDAEGEQEHRLHARHLLGRQVAKRPPNPLGPPRGARGVGHRRAGKPFTGHSGRLRRRERRELLVALHRIHTEAARRLIADPVQRLLRQLRGLGRVEDRLGRAVGDDVAGLGRRQVVVQRREVEPRLRHRHEELQHLGPVLQHHGDAVALLHPHRTEPMHQLVRTGQQRAKGHSLSVGLHHRDVVGVGLRLLPETKGRHARHRGSHRRALMAASDPPPAGVATSAISYRKGQRPDPDTLRQKKATLFL